MFPARCRNEPCMNIDVNTVSPAGSWPGGTSQGVAPLSVHGMPAYSVTDHGGPPLPLSGSDHRPFCRTKYTNAFAAISAIVTHAVRSVGMLSLSGNRDG